MAHDTGRALCDEVVWLADAEGLLSDEHFSVHKILIKVATNLQSFLPKNGPPPSDDDSGNLSVDFRGENQSYKTHASTTDPEARLLRKGWGKEARREFLVHFLMEHRHCLLMDFTVSQATDTAEQDAVLELRHGVWERGYRPRTWLATATTIPRLVCRTFTHCGCPPHVAWKQHAPIDGRTTRQIDYAVSLRLHKRGEEIFGWIEDRMRLATHPLPGRGAHGAGRLLGFHGACKAQESQTLEPRRGVPGPIGPLPLRFRVPSLLLLPSKT